MHSAAVGNTWQFLSQLPTGNSGRLPGSGPGAGTAVVKSVIERRRNTRVMSRLRESDGGRGIVADA